MAFGEQGVVFQFTIDGVDQVNRELSRYGEYASDLSKPFRAIAQDFRSVVMRQQFDSEGSYSGQRWAPLNERYARWKGNHYPGRPILVLNSRMKDSLASKTGDTIEEISPKELVLGTSVPYAIYHQRGTKHTPRRAIIDLTEADKTRWVKLIQSYLIDEARKDFASLMPDIGAARSHLRNI